MTDKEIIDYFRGKRADAELSGLDRQARKWAIIEARFTELSTLVHPPVEDLIPKWEQAWRDQFDGIVNLIVKQYGGTTDGV